MADMPWVDARKCLPEVESWMEQRARAEDAIPDPLIAEHFRTLAAAVRAALARGDQCDEIQRTLDGWRPFLQAHGMDV